VNGILAADLSGRDGSTGEGRRYGPTAPGEYYIRVEPRSISMAHTQRPHVTVYIESRDGQPQDDVLVSFLPSEGTILTGESSSRGGMVRGTFVAGTGGDNPRTASILITVENIDVTVFVDIVPAVFGR
jgi:hypothetical protein